MMIMGGGACAFSGHLWTLDFDPLSEEMVQGSATLSKIRYHGLMRPMKLKAKVRALKKPSQSISPLSLSLSRTSFFRTGLTLWPLLLQVLPVLLRWVLWWIAGGRTILRTFPATRRFRCFLNAQREWYESNSIEYDRLMAILLSLCIECINLG